MNGRLRTHERYLACLRAQVVLGPIAEEFAEAWERALERGDPLPDVLGLVEDATRASVPVISLAPLDGYLRRCAQARRVPDPDRVVMFIVHGYAESRMMGMNGETCGCPAREPLL